MAEKSAMGWYYDGTDSKAQQVADTGATVAWVKAGGDGGVAWIPGAPTGGFANHQWDEGYLTPLTSRGVECRAWYYNRPVPEDQRVVGDTLAVRWSPSICLNVETEWRVGTPSSPYNTLAQANAYAEAWVRTLRQQIGARFPDRYMPTIGFSSCPSWADFPYEGLAAGCDFAMPQHYWPANLLNGEDQVTAHYRRAPQTPCVAVLTACREYDDAGVLDLARSALLHPVAGLSAWEFGSAAYQADAMKQAYALIPQEQPQQASASPFLRMWRQLFAA